MSLADPVSRYLRAADGKRLFVREYGAIDAERTIVLVHGYGEHGGRYANALQPLLQRGFRILVPDVRGHGRSDGQRGHVAQFRDYLEDLAVVLREVRSPPSATGLLAHSHGGLIVLRALLEGRTRVAAAAVSSPLLGIAVQPPAWKATAGRVLSRVLPKVSLPTEIEAEWVSHDPAVVAAYTADPLNHHVVNARWYTEALAAMAYCFEHAAARPVPVLVRQAGDDKLVDADASERWARAAGATFERIDGAYHELMFEPNGREHAERFAAWLDEHVGAER